MVKVWFLPLISYQSGSVGRDNTLFEEDISRGRPLTTQIGDGQQKITTCQCQVIMRKFGI